MICDFVEHYHAERHHQGLGGRRIAANDDEEKAPLASGPVRRHKRLGGMLNYYYRDAA